MPRSVPPYLNSKARALRDMRHAAAVMGRLIDLILNGGESTRRLADLRQALIG